MASEHRQPAPAPYSRADWRQWLLTQCALEAEKVQHKVEALAEFLDKEEYDRPEHIDLDNFKTILSEPPFALPKGKIDRICGAIKTAKGGPGGLSGPRNGQSAGSKETIVHFKLEFYDMPKPPVLEAATFPFAPTAAQMCSFITRRVTPVPTSVLLSFGGVELAGEQAIPATTTPESPLHGLVRHPAADGKSQVMSSLGPSSIAQITAHNGIAVLSLPWKPQHADNAVPPFEWTEATEPAHSNRYVTYFKTFIAPQSRLQFSDVRGNQHLFSVPSNRLPPTIASLRGTCDLVAHPHSDTSFTQLFMLIEVKRTFSGTHQLSGEVLGAEFKSLVPTVGLLTDLQDTWHFTFFGDSTLLAQTLAPLGGHAHLDQSCVLYELRLTRSEAVVAIRDYLHHMDSLFGRGQKRRITSTDEAKDPHESPLLKCTKTILSAPQHPHRSPSIDTQPLGAQKASTNPTETRPRSASSGPAPGAHSPVLPLLPFNPLVRKKFDPFSLLAPDECERIVEHASTLSPQELCDLKWRIVGSQHTSLNTGSIIDYDRPASVHHQA